MSGALQDSSGRMAELVTANKRVLQELADFKAESKELRNQDLTIKRLEAQLGQLKAQLQNKVTRQCRTADTRWSTCRIMTLKTWVQSPSFAIR